MIVVMVFSEVGKLNENYAKEKEMIINQGPRELAPVDSANGDLKLFMVWKSGKCVSPAVEVGDLSGYDIVTLQSTNKTDLYGDSSEYRRKAFRWVSQYSLVAISIYKSTEISNRSTQEM